MSSSIKIKVKKADEKYDLGASKFFGTPTIPLEWEDDFYDTYIFLCQIRLDDIAKLDKENKLPHKGYLYIFLDTEDGEYDLKPIVRYSEKEPELAYDDFNATVEGYEQYTQAWLMEFCEADEDDDGTKLFGSPSGWYDENEEAELLMQFDPLDSEMGFLDNMDGFLYFFFGEDRKNFDDITIYEEYS